MEVDINKIIQLAESAERRAKELHAKYAARQREADQFSNGEAWDSATVAYREAASVLNDFFYWSGKATSYRWIVAMVELATIVEDELDSEPSCP